MWKLLASTAMAGALVLGSGTVAAASEPSVAGQASPSMVISAFGKKDYREYKRYFNKYLPKSSSAKPMKRSEATRVARNFCDNSVDDFESYFTVYSVVAAETEALAQGAALIDAYCPSARRDAMRGADAAGFLAPWPGKKATSGGNAAGKAAYIATVNTYAPATLVVDDALLLEVGIVTCQLLDDGGSFTDIVEAAIESDLDSEAAAAIVVGAVTHLCPGHQQFLESWLDT